jgi:hypothetical protein
MGRGLAGVTSTICSARRVIGSGAQTDLAATVDRSEWQEGGAACGYRARGRLMSGGSNLGFATNEVGQVSSVERSAKRRAENEATFREANEHLEEKAAELSFSQERTPYLCECESERCNEVILLSRQEYEAVRANPKTFVVLAGHHQSPYNIVVREEAGFTVIEKSGEEGELVAERDPRAAR